MLCHKQVSLHINYIYQLVRERLGSRYVAQADSLVFYPQILAAAAQPRKLVKLEYGISFK